MYNDAVSAYALIKRYRTTEYALSNSGWTLLDSAEQIFKLSKERVYNEQGGKLFFINIFKICRLTLQNPINFCAQLKKAIFIWKAISL